MNLWSKFNLKKFWRVKVLKRLAGRGDCKQGIPANVNIDCGKVNYNSGNKSDGGKNCRKRTLNFNRRGG